MNKTSEGGPSRVDLLTPSKVQIIWNEEREKLCALYIEDGAGLFTNLTNFFTTLIKVNQFLIPGQKIVSC